jgi:hypothetical protein
MLKPLYSRNIASEQEFRKSTHDYPNYYTYDGRQHTSLHTRNDDKSLADVDNEGLLFRTDVLKNLLVSKDPKVV